MGTYQRSRPESGREMTVETHPFPPAFIAFLKKEGKQLATIERVKSKKQWAIAERVIAEWDALPEEVKEEMSKEVYYSQVAYFMNQGQDYNVTAESGETIDWWCKIVKTYENLPVLDAWKDVLSFDHFAKAKSLAGKGLVTAEDKALAIAYDRKFTAGEMVKHFTNPTTSPAWKIEVQKSWHQGFWSVAYLLHDVKNKQIEFHLREAEKLYKQERETK